MEKREENEKERLDLAKKLSLNCRSERQDREINAELESLENDLDEDDDEFLKEVSYALTKGPICCHQNHRLKF